MSVVGRRPQARIGMYQGADLRVIMSEITDETGLAVDISDAQDIEWWVARTARAATPILKRSLSDGSITINNPTSFFFDLLPADTEGMQGAYYMEARIWTDQGFNDVALAGQFYVHDALIPSELSQ